MTRAMNVDRKPAVPPQPARRTRRHPGMAATLACALLCSAGAARAAEPRLDALLEKARAATGIRALDELGAVRVTGSSTIAGLNETFELIFDAKGRFVQRMDGPLTLASGFDGRTAWTHDLAGEQRVLDLSDRDQTVTSIRSMTGWWFHPDAPSEFSLDESRPGGLVWKWKGELAEARVMLDPATGFPVSWTTTRNGAERASSSQGELRLGGLVLPARADTGEGGGEIVLSSIEKYEATDDTFAPRISAPTDVKFDPSMPAALELTRAKSGHLLVKARLNGQDAGYFIFDTGAGGTVVSKALAEKMGIKAFGVVPMVGIGGKIDSSFVRPESFSVGPMTVESLVMTTLDTAFLTAAMGYEINGIVGYGVMHRAVVEYDNTGMHAALHNPATFSRPGLAWENMRIAARVPAALASIAGKDGVDHEGWFRLDTGASQRTVTIHFPIVEKYKLLEGRQTTESKLGGVGGMLKTRTGPIDHFTIGGWKRENIEIEFATESKGALADPYTMGNIGGKLLDGFVIFFDYQGRRIAFERK